MTSHPNQTIEIQGLQNWSDDYQNLNLDSPNRLHLQSGSPLPNPNPPRKSRSKKKTESLNQPDGGSEKSAPDVAPAGSKKVPANQQKLITELAGLYATIGLVAASVDTTVGGIIMQNAEARATELVNVAKHHPPMMKFLKSLTQGNDYAALVIGHGLMAYTIAAHLGYVPTLPFLAGMTGQHGTDIQG